MVLPITKPKNHRQNLRLCISSNPFFTQKTTTSPVENCTFVQISGKFDYSNIYTDPDGRDDEDWEDVLFFEAPELVIGAPTPTPEEKLDGNSLRRPQNV
jgi:hypothetical protein